MTEAETALRRVTEARVLRGCVRDATELSTFPTARKATLAAFGGQPLSGFAAKLVAEGQVAEGMGLIAHVASRRELRQATPEEERAAKALQDWVDQFFQSGERGRR